MRVSSVVSFLHAVIRSIRIPGPAAIGSRDEGSHARAIMHCKEI